MNALDRHLCTAVLRGIDLTHELREDAVLALAPCGRLCPHVEDEVRPRRHRPRHHDDFIQTLIHRGAREILDVYLMFIHAENAEVRRSLHLVRMEMRHIMHARTQKREKINEVTFLRFVDHTPCILHGCKRKLHCRICRSVKRVKTLFFRHEYVHNFALTEPGANDRLRRRRNRVARRAAHEGDNLDFSALLERLQCKCKRTDRVAAPVADALTRVPTKETFDRDAVGR